MQKGVATFFLALAFALAGPVHAAGPMTRKCNTSWQAQDIIVQFTNTVTRDALVSPRTIPRATRRVTRG